MIQTQAVTPDLRDAVEAIRTGCGHQSASHAFPSLFLWQKDLALSLCLREDMYAVRSACGEEPGWFFPCGEQQAVCAFLEELLQEEPSLRLKYLRKEDTLLLEDFFPGRFRISPADDASEYLYDRREYMETAGKKYEDIRWNINRLKSRHELRTEPLGPSNLADVRDMLAGWKPRAESEYFSPDHETAVLMLQYYDFLGMTGAVVYADGTAAALAAGFPLSGGTYDIAFSKAPELERGLQFYVRRELIAMLPAQYTIINGEEDLGIPGLRRSKLQENPIGRIEMFTAYEQKGQPMD